LNLKIFKILIEWKPMSCYINLLLALSNIVSLPLIYKLYKTEKYIDALFVSGSTLASILQHLSDVKHSQIGFWPFRTFAYGFLNFDRLMCIVTALYLLPRVPLSLKETNVGTYFCFGIIMMILSEKWFGPQKQMLEFLLCHSTWHFCAYKVLHLLCSSKKGIPNHRTYH